MGNEVYPYMEGVFFGIIMYTKHDLPCIPDLLAYASLNIMNAARCFKGNGWQVYDTNSHSQAAANSLTVKAETNFSLWTTVFNTPEAFHHFTH